MTSDSTTHEPPPGLGSIWVLHWVITSLLMAVFLAWLELNVQAQHRLNDIPYEYPTARIIATAIIGGGIATLAMHLWLRSRGSA